MFGVGLKTASLSQADSLIVVSRANFLAVDNRIGIKSGKLKEYFMNNKYILRPVSEFLEHCRMLEIMSL